MDECRVLRGQNKEWVDKSIWVAFDSCRNKGEQIEMGRTFIKEGRYRGSKISIKE